MAAMAMLKMSLPALAAATSRIGTYEMDGYTYFLADAMQSCEDACEAQGAECDEEGLAKIAVRENGEQLEDTCGEVIGHFGLSVDKSKSKHRGLPPAGCTYSFSTSTAWVFGVHNRKPTCQAKLKRSRFVGNPSKLRRVCTCVPPPSPEKQLITAFNGLFAIDTIAIVNEEQPTILDSLALVASNFVAPVGPVDLTTLIRLFDMPEDFTDKKQVLIRFLARLFQVSDTVLPDIQRVFLRALNLVGQETEDDIFALRSLFRRLSVSDQDLTQEPIDVVLQQLLQTEQRIEPVDAVLLLVRRALDLPESDEASTDAREGLAQLIKELQNKTNEAARFNEQETSELARQFELVQGAISRVFDQTIPSSTSTWQLNARVLQFPILGFSDILSRLFFLSETTNASDEFSLPGQAKLGEVFNRMLGVAQAILPSRGDDIAILQKAADVLDAAFVTGPILDETANGRLRLL